MADILLYKYSGPFFREPAKILFPKKGQPKGPNGGNGASKLASKFFDNPGHKKRRRFNARNVMKDRILIRLLLFESSCRF